MPSAVRLREDYSAERLRALARRPKDVNQSRRLLSLAAVRERHGPGLGGESAAWTARALRGLGPSLPAGRVRRASSTTGRSGSRAPPFGGATGSGCADRRGGSAS